MTHRRLAAIMFTDIVGYTALMGSDERKAFDFLKKNRRIHWRLIKKYSGRWLKEMGDGTLASFSSSMDAVMCAISIQLAAKEMDIPLRIGIHQGDVVFEQKDVLGDGVNIASRIQGVAETQGIAISETIYQQIRNKEGLEVASLGTKSLKGVPTPMGVYKVSCSDPGILDYKIDTGELLQPIGNQRNTVIAGFIIATLLLIAVYALVINKDYFKKQDNSVLVMPFDDFTGIDTLDYVLAGMHNALIGNIGRISGLRVLGKTTADAYKDTNKSLTEIGQERDVKTIIESALSCFGEDSICFIAKIFDVYPREKQVGYQEFRVSRSQFPALYNLVTKEFTNSVDLTLTPEEEQFLAESRTVDKEVYDAYLRSYQFIGDASLASLDKTIKYLNIAIEKEPDWAPLYSGLAGAWLTYLHMGYASPTVAIPKVYENINKALELDPNLPDAHGQSAMIAHLMEWDWVKSEKEFLRALAINPNDAFTRIFYAQYLSTMQRPDEALLQGQLAFELDPLNPMMKCQYAALLGGIGHCKTSLAVAEEVLAADPNHFLANSVIAESAFQCGNYDRVFEADMIFLKNIFDADSISKIEAIFEEKDLTEANEEVRRQLEAYVERNPFGPVAMAIFYMRWNLSDKAMEWLEKGFEMHDPQMIYITTQSYHFDPLFNNPRFLDIVEKMNLSLPKK